MSVRKVHGGYENIGKTGKKHGVFKTKAQAERQKAAMFEHGFKVKGGKSKLRKAVEDAVNKHMKE